MNQNNLKYYRAPATLESLELKILKQEGDYIKRGQFTAEKSKKVFSIVDDIVDFSYPEKLKDLDKEFNAKYDVNAAQYDKGMDWLFSSFYENEDDVRNKLINLLALKPNFKVLNIGCGTGSDSLYILKKLNSKSVLFNADLSHGLLKIAHKKLASSASNVEFVVANASYLPFANGIFDAVFHFGGINIFSEKKRAIDEMTRVTKHGGKVVFGDESAAPWLKNKTYGKIIKNANPLYKHQAPINLLPESAQDVSVHYLLGNSFYAITYTVGDIPRLNLDLLIPGKRGGTLRSRYEANFKKLKI